MCKFWNKLTGKNTSTANVSAEHLVVSLPGATEPLVWRIELSKVSASTFEVHEKENGLHSLCLKDAAGKHKDISSFSNKEDAVQALMCISSALQNVETSADTKTQSSKKSTSAPETARPVQNAPVKSDAVKWVLTIAGVAAVLALFFYLASITPKSSEAFLSDQAATSAPENAGTSSGVPVSADDFLNGL